MDSNLESGTAAASTTAVASATAGGREIGNVGVLDLRRAGPMALDSIRHIGNVGVVLYSAETAGLLSKLRAGNLGTTIEVPADARVLSGQITLGKDTLRGQEKPVDFIISGQLLIHPELTAEEITQGLGSLYVSGQLICPEHLLGALQSKLRQMNGETLSYEATGHYELIAGNLTLDAAVLAGLADGTSLFVAGNLRLPRVLSNDLLGQKLAQVFAAGNVLCHEENASALQAHLSHKNSKVKVIPTGYELVEEPLRLDRVLLQALPSIAGLPDGRKLYCTDWVAIDMNVEPADIAERMDGLMAEGPLFCPSGLQEAIGRCCNPLTTRIVFYEGELWVVEGEETFSAARFDYLDGKATLVVMGELKLEPDLEGRTLASHLARVHNLGEIVCTPSQRGALQARLGINEGAFTDSTATREPGEGIGNVGMLTL